MKQRIQRPDVLERKDRSEYYWHFRYRDDVIQPDGTIKTTRPFVRVWPSRGKDKITHREACIRRDGFFAGTWAKGPDGWLAPATAQAAATEPAPTAAPAPAAAIEPALAPAPPAPTAPTVEHIVFGRLAKLWREDYVDNPKVRLATPTRLKYRMRMDNHILPRWKDARLADLNDSKAIVDWLQAECTSWWMMVDLRNIMSGVITRAQEWSVIPRSYVNPMQWVNLGRKWVVREDRILTDEETADVFARLEDPHLLICETCIYTGTRISEAVGLQLKCIDLKKGAIKIEQRHCRGDVDAPKSASSRRVLALGSLAERYMEWIGKKEIQDPNAWIFAQSDEHGGRHSGDPTRPMWDSGVRKALKTAAKAAGCDFPGFGLHSFRRANITLRQEVGGSAIEASKIAGHSGLAITGEYTKVQLRRQEELTRAIQERIEEARLKQEEVAAGKESGREERDKEVAA